MDAQLSIPDVLSNAGLDAALRGLQGIAEAELELDPSIPPLYDAGVIYEREPRGSERWLAPSLVLGRGAGDCEDLASWRAGELVVTGEDPFARAVALQSGPRRWHAVVERSDGTIEDPSAFLGMTGPGGIASPVRFTIDPEGPRDYRARVDLVGLGEADSSESIASCPICALSGALGAAGATELGFLPFVAPVVDMFSKAAQAALPGVLPGGIPGAPPRLPSMPQRAPSAAVDIQPLTIDEGLLRLAQSLRQLAKREARRRLERARRRL